MANGQSKLKVGQELDIRVALDHWKAIGAAACTPGMKVGLVEKVFDDGYTVYSKVIQLYGDRWLKLKVVHVLKPGVIDVHWWQESNYESKRRRVFVNGRQVFGIWYADIHRGFVKTYALDQSCPSFLVKHDGFGPEDFPGREVEITDDGILSETLWGKVELKPWEAES